jgi:hypothetical protein
MNQDGVPRMLALASRELHAWFVFCTLGETGQDDTVETGVTEKDRSKGVKVMSMNYMAWPQIQRFPGFNVLILNVWHITSTGHTEYHHRTLCVLATS